MLVENAQVERKAYLEARVAWMRHCCRPGEVLPSASQSIFFEIMVECGDWNRAHPDDKIEPPPPLDRVFFRPAPLMVLPPLPGQ